MQVNSSVRTLERVVRLREVSSKGVYTVYINVDTQNILHAHTILKQFSSCRLIHQFQPWEGVSA